MPREIRYGKEVEPPNRWNKAETAAVVVLAVVVWGMGWLLIGSFLWWLVAEMV